MEIRRRELLLNELVIKAVRSSGPGGQNVNKVNTKVELRFNVNESGALSLNEKLLINVKLGNKINTDGELVLSDQTSRSQLKNKEIAINRFLNIIEQALKKQKKRVATKPTKQSKRKRLDDKKRLSEKKNLRQKWKG